MLSRDLKLFREGAITTLSGSDSALSRLYSSDGSPNFFNLSWYDRCLILVSNFVALLWT